MKKSESVVRKMLHTVRKPWHSQRLKTVVEGDSMTQQSHAASCDINTIVGQFTRTGFLPPGRDGEPQYADVTGLQGDLTEKLIKSQQVIDDAIDFGKNYKPPQKQKPEPEPKPKSKPSPMDPDHNVDS